jgi:hypothetical protein
MRKVDIQSRNVIIQSRVPPSFVPNYVRLTVSPSPMLHQFREVRKDKWVSKDTFKV